MSRYVIWGRLVDSDGGIVKDTLLRAAFTDDSVVQYCIGIPGPILPS